MVSKCNSDRGIGAAIVPTKARWQDSLRAAQGAQVCKSTAASCGKDSLHDPWSHERCREDTARVEPRWEDEGERRASCVA